MRVLSAWQSARLRMCNLRDGVEDVTGLYS
jgi:hypothetical protein